jgi:DNA invertase Pin-like site-specific DNA recombinase
MLILRILSVTVQPNRVAVLLGRVSRGERQQDPESQLGPLRAAAARLGWTVAREVSLKLSAWDDETAAEVRRQALAPIEVGKADTLMVWAWDRFSREGIEGAFRELRHLEDHLGAAFWSLQEPFLSTAAPREQRELLLSIIAWAARWESQRKSDRLKAKVASKRARAESLGQRARWGRGVVASWLEVQRVHELRLTGQTVRGIAGEMKLSKSQVARILAAVPPHAEGQAGAQEGEGAPVGG